MKSENGRRPSGVSIRWDGGLLLALIFLASCARLDNDILPIFATATHTPTAITIPTATVTPSPTRSLTPTTSPTITLSLTVTFTPTPAPIFSEEFDGNELDASRWATTYYWGDSNYANNELECYTPDSVRLEGGYLHLQATYNPVDCRLDADSEATTPYSYRSGMISSHVGFHFQYGYAEARIKIPKGNGLWPAFWMMVYNDPIWLSGWPPEIDVMEVVGFEPGKAYMTNWYGTSANPQFEQYAHHIDDFSLDFHIFAIDWQAEYIRWYVDGVEYFAVTSNIPDVPMYLIANLAIGGWGGQVDGTTNLPQELLIDYIRVYDQKP